MPGSRWDTPLFVDRGDCPVLVSRWDAPLLGVRNDNVLTPPVFIDRFIGKHGWRKKIKAGITRTSIAPNSCDFFMAIHRSKYLPAGFLLAAGCVSSFIEYP